jgi:predicted permease
VAHPLGAEAALIAGQERARLVNFDLFLGAFGATFRATMLLAAVAVIGYGAARAGWLEQRIVRLLAAIQIRLVLPLVILRSAVASFDPADPVVRHVIPLLGLWMLGWIAATLLFLWVIALVTGRPLRENRPLLALGLVNNSVFIPTPILLVLLPPDDARRAIFFLACYLLYIQTFQWTAGVWLIGRRLDGWWSQLKRLANPPTVMALACYTLLSVPGFRATLQPDAAAWALLDGAKVLIGPLGMLILGALFHEAPPRWRGHRRDIVSVGLLRGLWIPLLSLGALIAFFHDPLLGLVIMLQGCTPPATNLTVIAAHYDGPIGRITSVLLPTYLVAIVTIPLYLGLYGALVTPIGG